MTWWTGLALAQTSIDLREGPTVLQPCLDEPACVDYFGPQLSETLVEAGYALQHEPIGTSAFGSSGIGVVAELGVSSTPLGEPNQLQSMFPSVPAVPRIALGGTYQFQHLALAGGLHGFPRLTLGDGTTGAFGASASAAGEVAGLVRLGGELSWTSASFRVSLFESTADLRSFEAIAPYVPRGFTCEEPCLDELRQQSLSARAGVGVVPIDVLFVYLKGGVTSQSQRLSIALDDSEWGLGPLMPEWVVGFGTRLGGRWQLGGGLATAYRPWASSTERRSMTKIAVSTAFRFGP
jgi:hypothetical protein